MLLLPQHLQDVKQLTLAPAASFVAMILCTDTFSDRPAHLLLALRKGQATCAAISLSPEPPSKRAGVTKGRDGRPLAATKKDVPDV